MTKNNDDVFDEFDDEQDPDATELPREIEMPSHEDLVKLVSELESQLEGQKDKMIRTHAEMENTRRRAKLDVQEAHNFGLKKFANALLPVIDTLERSLEIKVDDNELAQSLHKGVEMTLDIFMSTLTKFEIEVVNPVGDVFNPDFHEAVQTLEDPEEASGNVLKVLQKGYTLHGRLLRPAMVVIAS